MSRTDAALRIRRALHAARAARRSRDVGVELPIVAYIVADDAIECESEVAAAIAWRRRWLMRDR